MEKFSLLSILSVHQFMRIINHELLFQVVDFVSCVLNEVLLIFSLICFLCGCKKIRCQRKKENCISMDSWSSQKSAKSANLNRKCTFQLIFMCLISLMDLYACSFVLEVVSDYFLLSRIARANNIEILKDLGGSNQLLILCIKF